MFSGDEGEGYVESEERRVLRPMGWRREGKGREGKGRAWGGGGGVLLCCQKRLGE